MSTHLITGYAGREHITAADQGSFNAAIMGTGEFVLERGKQFQCQVISNNKVRIYDGDALMQGRHIIIDRNTYEETTHDNGTQGYKRFDLIVLTYEKNTSTGVENVTLDVIKGTPAENNPEVPSYITGDIVDQGAFKNQMPLYKIPFNGLSIGTPVKLFSTVETNETMKANAMLEIETRLGEVEGEIQSMIVSDLDEMSMIENYGEYVADAKTVGELNDVLSKSQTLETVTVNANLTIYKYGKLRVARLNSLSITSGQNVQVPTDCYPNVFMSNVGIAGTSTAARINLNTSGQMFFSNGEGTRITSVVVGELVYFAN